jgi:predicted nucleic acid-binding protein
VLDANVVLDRTFMKWLEGYHDRKVLPVIAYAELAYAFLKKYESTEKLDRALHWADVRVERMDRLEGFRTAEIAALIDRPEWRKQFRDYCIASFAYLAPHLLVTKDQRNFAFLQPRVRDPYQLMAEYGST